MTILTLWDLIAGRKERPPKPAAVRPGSRRADPLVNADGSESMAGRYERIQHEMLERYGIRVRKWRSSMSGVAWEVHYRDGTITRLVEAPRPRGPMSAAVFLHEVGHHAIGFKTYRPRCLEEYKAWAWSLAQMELNGLNVTDGVRRRMHESLWYAVEKARRRGLKRLPPELEPFLDRPPKRVRTNNT